MRSLISIALLFAISTISYGRITFRTNPNRGFIACYAHGSDSGLRTIADGIQLLGYYDIPGHYNIQGIFQPKGFEGQDISALQSFKDLCNKHFPFCDDLNGCWAGGDTLPHALGVIFPTSAEEEGVLVSQEEIIEVPAANEGAIACYAHTTDDKFISAGNDIRVIGYVPMQGSYDSQSIFYPKGFEGQDISALKHFKDICNTNFPFCNDLNGCWAGGDTLGYHPRLDKPTVATAPEDQEPVSSTGSVACYARTENNHFLSVGDSIRVIGYVPLAGAYDNNGIFQPQGYEGQDISALQHFKDLCNTNFRYCDDLNGCWAGGDTIGFPVTSDKPVLAFVPEEQQEETTETPSVSQGTIACYGRNPILNSLKVVGQILLDGAYDTNGIFQPKGFEGQDISALQHFKDLCNDRFRFCEDLSGCWAGGDTLGSMMTERPFIYDDDSLASFFP